MVNFGNMVERMLSVETSFEVQFSIAVFLAMVWSVWFEIWKAVFIPWMRTRNWYESMLVILERQMGNFGIVQGTKNKEEWKQFLTELHACLIGAMFQHGLGGLLCVPMVFGFDTFPWTGMYAYQFAQLGGLVEVGWELYDYTMRLLNKEPVSALVIVGIHHLCAQLIVIPCNMNCTSWAFACQVANLQGVAAIALIADSRFKTLNINKPEDVVEMAYLAIACGIVMISGRGPMYVYFAYYLIWDIIAAKAWFTLVCALIGGVCMLFFNFLIILDSCKRMKKFYTLAFCKVEEETKEKLVRQLTEDAGLILQVPLGLFPEQGDYDLKSFVLTNRSFYANDIFPEEREEDSKLFMPKASNSAAF